MNRLKQLALASYYYSSLPYRRACSSKAAESGQAPVMILFYHRVADEYPNDWTLSNLAFEQQIGWLQEHFDLVSLAEAQQRIRSGHNDRPAVSITFDDGYADNCLSALPLLIKNRIPCTYFVATRFVLEGEMFPHDRRNGQPLRPNTIDQLQALAESGVEIGAHTHTHADLGMEGDTSRLHEEIVMSRELLHELLKKPIRYFAFPYGLHENLNTEAFHLARRVGYEAVCSAYGGYNFPGDDPFHLQRIHADPEMIRLKNWLTVDPRKRSKIKRFQYEAASKQESSGHEMAAL